MKFNLNKGGSGNCNCQTGWVNGVNGFCSACASGYYGPTCLECPNCGANGHCSEGVIGDMGGDGSCICNFGWASIENPSNSTGYCNKCAPGFAGTNCNVCDIGFQGLNCDQCKPGFSGQSCNICEAGTFPDCYSPISCPLGCSSNGECNDRNGQCSCHVGFKNSGCNTCIWDTDIYPNCSPVISLHFLFFSFLSFFLKKKRNHAQFFFNREYYVQIIVQIMVFVMAFLVIVLVYQNMVPQLVMNVKLVIKTILNVMKFNNVQIIALQKEIAMIELENVLVMTLLLDLLAMIVHQVSFLFFFFFLKKKKNFIRS